MGTCIRIEAIKGENTTHEQWELIDDYFSKNYNNYDSGDNYLAVTVNCSYSSADLEAQFDKEILETLKGSDISLNLWYEERDPDQTINL